MGGMQRLTLARRSFPAGVAAAVLQALDVEIAPTFAMTCCRSRSAFERGVAA